MPQVMAAVAIGPVAILPCFSPKNRSQKDNKRSSGEPFDAANVGQFGSPGAAGTSFERVVEDAVVVETFL